MSWGKGQGHRSQKALTLDRPRNFITSRECGVVYLRNSWSRSKCSKCM